MLGKLANLNTRSRVLRAASGESEMEKAAILSLLGRGAIAAGKLGTKALKGVGWVSGNRGKALALGGLAATGVAGGSAALKAGKAQALGFRAASKVPALDAWRSKGMY